MEMLISIKEAAQRLAVSRSTLYTLMDKGEIPSVKVGKLRRISVTALEEYVSRLEQVRS